MQECQRRWMAKEREWKARWDAREDGYQVKYQENLAAMKAWSVFLLGMIWYAQGAVAMYTALALLGLSAIAGQGSLGPLEAAWSPFPGVVFGIYRVATWRRG